ncbi:hypothetical protein D3C72_1312220 [compost metagenome]
MGGDIFAHDGQADAIAVTRAGRLAHSLVKRFKNTRSILGRHAGALVDAVDAHAAAFARQGKPHGAAFRAEAYGIRQQIGQGRRQLVAVGLHDQGYTLHFNRQTARQPLQALAGHHILQQDQQIDLAVRQVLGVKSGGIVAQQVLDLRLQGRRVLLQDAGDFALAIAELACHLIFQQGHAFAQGRQRGLQLMRDVAQKTFLVGVEVGQALAQPVQLLAQAARVGRTADDDGLVVALVTEALDGRLDAAQRTRQQEAEAGGQHGRQQHGAAHQHAQQAALAFQLGQQGIVAAADFRLAFARQAVIDLRHAGKRAVHDGVAIALAALACL